MDSRQAQGKHSEYAFFRGNGFKVKLKRGKGRGVMHNKFIIFDGKLLMTGSYNISENAEQFNHENVLFISDKMLIEKYQTLFNTIYLG